MINKLSDVYIFSDVDKTLYSKAIGFPKGNLEAIKGFTEKGGHFAIATGRGINATTDLTNYIDFNFPCVICNGGAIYDFKENKFLLKNYLKPKAKEYAKEILATYPTIGMAVVTDSGYYYVASGENRQKRFHAKVFFNGDTIDTIKEDIYKFLLTVPDEECASILKELKDKNYSDVDFSSSDTFYIDMLPYGVTKASAIKKLAQIKNIPLENIITVGDYYNDIEMLSLTPNSACVAGSPQELQNICNIKLCPFEDGAIADLIEKIEEGLNI